MVEDVRFSHSMNASVRFLATGAEHSIDTHDATQNLRFSMLGTVRLDMCIGSSAGASLFGTWYRFIVCSTFCGMTEKDHFSGSPIRSGVAGGLGRFMAFGCRMGRPVSGSTASGGSSPLGLLEGITNRISSRVRRSRKPLAWGL
jgi:hypothetical protein